eukprot:TRINITY_DN5756_c1_g1_i1.p1 TRINITY_DN5756_c1_g1~~TRINITY_DN5756_c1_g1_i1.p1  ORF type:complete len:281 (-),score=100.58 TRINITY_DN5756_c1_g1_i1:77-880(-)
MSAKKSKVKQEAPAQAESDAEPYCFCKDAFLEDCPPHLGIHVMCDQCKSWFHSECCGIPIHEAPNVTFLCKIHKDMQAKAKKKKTAADSSIGKKRDRAQDDASAQSKKRRKTASGDAWSGNIKVGPNATIPLLGAVVLGSGPTVAQALQVTFLKPVGRMESEAWWTYAEKLHSQSRSRVVCALTVQTKEEADRNSFRELMRQQHEDRRVLVMDLADHSKSAVLELYLAPVMSSDELAPVYREALGESSFTADNGIQYMLLFALKRPE